VGNSEFSSLLSVLAAQLPDQPQSVATTSGAGLVAISWTCNDRGSAITSYVVKIRINDGLTYMAESEACLSTDATVISTRSCSIPISTLMASPYSLPWGSSIYATVQATNAYGTSSVSFAGNGAIILTTPAAVTVSNFAPGSTSTQIHIIWTASASNGGTAVIDYEV
jgi:hypothetical protein